MINKATLFCLGLLILCGVFGADTAVMKSEGDSVTLNTDVTEVQRDDQILWMFGPKETRIAEIHKGSIDMFSSNKTFGDRLQMNSSTGSLSIRNIRTTDSGLYKLLIMNNRETSYKRFNLTVYARLPVPVITSNSSNCSSSKACSVSRCSLLCSVLNVSHVTLSWYKGNSLLSSISVSDLSISLSLPLEVKYQENNTYSCVLNNPITNQTTHLDISEVCQTRPEQSQHSHLISITVSVVVLLLLVTAVTAFVIRYHAKECKQSKEGDNSEEEHVYSNATLNHSSRDNKTTVADPHAVYSVVKM